MDHVKLSEYNFREICEIIPDFENGSIKEFMPQSRYKNAATASLNQYGKGPFCRFKIPKGINESGVYALYVDEKLKYIGQCENLSSRFNTNYGIISPKNCFIGGQSTNCRINNLILNASKAGKEIKLFFYKTDDFSKVESQLIDKFDPEWNIQKSRAPIITGGGTKKARTRSRKQNYHKLGKYLEKIRSNRIILTYEEIEDILERELPNSAYKYKAWWANSGHSHADAWSRFGWKTESVKLGEKIVFVKS